MSTYAFKHVLVPVDFGEASAQEDSIKVGDRSIHVAPTTRQCIALATRLGSTVRLFHSMPLVIPTALCFGPGGTVAQTETLADLNTEALKRSITELEAIAEHYCDPAADLQFRSAFGVATEQILGEAERFEADSIVVGSSGRGRVNRFVLGSTADKIIRLANCPVIVVPAL